MTSNGFVLVAICRLNGSINETIVEGPGKTEQRFWAELSVDISGICAEKLKHGTPSSIVQAHSAVFPTTCLQIPPIFRLFSAHFALFLDFLNGQQESFELSLPSASAKKLQTAYSLKSYFASILNILCAPIFFSRVCIIS